jgi:DNA-binding winged helix-turn-helix (wHTH) protein/Tol biopolymer transport system component
MNSDLKHLLEFGPFRVDPEQRLLFRDEQAIPLSPKAFDLLLVLLERNGQVVLKDDLMRLLWPDTFVEESNLGQHVFLIRKALGERAQGSSYIVTVPGRGYRFAQKVRTLSQEQKTDAKRSAALVAEVSTGGNGHHQEASLPADRPLALTGDPKLAGVAWQWPRVAALGLFAAAIGAFAVWFMLRPRPIPKPARTVHITNFGRVEPFSQALNDGPRVFFAERTGGIRSLAKVPDQGGDAALVWTSVDNLVIHDIDRRRSRLLVSSGSSEEGRPLWVVPTEGGSAQRVGDILANSAAWTPDQQRIFYSSDADLLVANADGSQSRKLFSASGVVEYLRCSPDGSRVSFTVRDLATSVLTLWEIASDGRDPHQMSFGWKAPIGRWGEGECCGDWSPDGKYFLFRSRRDRVASVWIVSEESNLSPRHNAPMQLYSSPDRLNQPRFSADGKKIFLIHYHEQRELGRYDEQKKNFFPYLGGSPARLLSFSRDGRWVAYRNEIDGSLWRSKPDGTQALQLTLAPMDSYHPAWSPDGKEIAFDNGIHLYTVAAEGGIPRALLPNDGSGIQPSWSPDGESIVFSSWPPWRNPAIRRFDRKTGETQMIAESGGFENPQWSPDGRFIAAFSRANRKMKLFDVARQSWTDLADGAPDTWGVLWSPDSKYLYYQYAYDVEEQPIFRIRVSDRHVEQITSARQILSTDVLTYGLTGLTPDGSPLVSFVHRNSDIYALELDVP